MRKKSKRPYQKRKLVKRNELISAPEVRVINDKGENIGIMKKEEAIALAKENELDLIQISDKTDPPIAKIMEYGKYVYQQEKKEKEARKKQATVNITKGVRLSIRTSGNDLKMKAQSVDKFLKKGYKVRVEFIMRGRERALKDMAQKRIKEFLETISEEYEIETEPSKHPRGLYFVLKKK